MKRMMLKRINEEAVKRKYKKSIAHKRTKPNKLVNWFIISFMALLLLVYLIIYLGDYIVILFACILAIVSLLGLRKIQRKRRLKGEIGGLLKKALIAMDSTARTFTDEEEANKELVGILKIQGHDVKYQFRLNGGRRADARIGDYLIEGKLAPKTDDVDRLIGQMQAYMKYSYRVYIVIYGRLSKLALKRIEGEINERYSDKIYLTYLDNPKRRRA